MTDAELHDAVWAILVRECKAHDYRRAAFDAVDLTQPNLCFRFGAQLGSEAIFGSDDEGVWFVNYHEADQTPRRDAMVARADAALRELQGA